MQNVCVIKTSERLWSKWVMRILLLCSEKGLCTLRTIKTISFVETVPKKIMASFGDTLLCQMEKKGLINRGTR